MESVDLSAQSKVFSAPAIVRSVRTCEFMTLCNQDELMFDAFVDVNSQNSAAPRSMRTNAHSLTSNCSNPRAMIDHVTVQRR